MPLFLLSVKIFTYLKSRRVGFLAHRNANGVVVGWVSNPPFARQGKINLSPIRQSTLCGVVVGWSVALPTLQQNLAVLWWVGLSHPITDAFFVSD